LRTPSDCLATWSLESPEGDTHAWFDGPSPRAALPEHRPAKVLIVLIIDERLCRGSPDAKSPLQLLVEGGGFLHVGAIRIRKQGTGDPGFATKHMHVGGAAATMKR